MRRNAIRTTLALLLSALAFFASCPGDDDDGGGDDDLGPAQTVPLRFEAALPAGGQIGAWTVAPRLAWQHDVKGVTPGPGGSFIEGVKAYTFGIGFEYQNAWQVDLSYTDYFGAGRWNLINDRDFIGGFIKYSF